MSEGVQRYYPGLHHMLGISKHQPLQLHKVLNHTKSVVKVLFAAVPGAIDLDINYGSIEDAVKGELGSRAGFLMFLCSCFTDAVFVMV